MITGLALACAASSSVRADWFGDAEGGVVAAHRAFLDRDLGTMALEAKKVLMNRDASPEEKANVLSLVAKAQQDACHEAIPVDWQLPEGVLSLDASLIRKEEPDALLYSFRLGGRMVEKDSIDGLRVVRWPDEVVLDRKAGVGEWYSEPEQDGRYYFDITSDDKVAPEPSGLYFAEFKLKSGEKASLWFIVTDMLSTESPTMYSPVAYERYHTATPTFRWADFFSPEYKSCEGRSMTLAVVSVDPAESYDLNWFLYRYDPKATEATVGSEKAAEGVSRLTDGDYWVALSFREHRKFGPMKLRRVSRTAVPFTIDTK